MPNCRSVPSSPGFMKSTIAKSENIFQCLGSVLDIRVKWGGVIDATLSKARGHAKTTVES